jgi:pilus assembly protein Flp/PilA
MRKLLFRLWQDESGQDLTEFALLMVLIALAAILGMKALANTINTVFSNAASNVGSQT